MSRFSRTAKMANGFVATCQRCGQKIVGYTYETFKARRTNHRKECRKTSSS